MARFGAQGRAISPARGRATSGDATVVSPTTTATFRRTEMASTAIGINTSTTGGTIDVCVPMGTLTSSVYRPLPWLSPGVKLCHASKKYPMQTNALGESTITKVEINRMVEEGKISSRSVALALPGEVVPAPQGYETVIFEAFFDEGLDFPGVLLLEGVIRYFYVELPQLSANAIARLAIFKWAMRAEGYEWRVKLFTAIHEASYQPKTWMEDGETRTLSFGSVNFLLQQEYQDALSSKEINKRWYTG